MKVVYTMQLVPVHLDLPLFWKSHCATYSPLLTSMSDFVPSPIGGELKKKRDGNGNSNVAIQNVNGQKNGCARALLFLIS